MPPAPRQVPIFAAEPPQEPLPYGRWAEALGAQFAAAAPDGIEVETGDISLVPRPHLERPHLPARHRAGRAAARCSATSPTRASTRAPRPPTSCRRADFTEETADQNPDWSLDLSDEEIGQWRGTEGRRGVVTLVWGVALVPNGAVVTAELGPTTTDQCELVDDRFTLVSLDAYTGDYVEVRLFGARGAELARESLYEDE